MLRQGDILRLEVAPQLLSDAPGPIVAVSDYVRAVPELISAFVPHRFVALGTDGYGRSDSREALRSFFETDMASVVVTVLSELAASGEIDPQRVAEAIDHYDLPTDQVPPWER